MDIIFSLTRRPFEGTGQQDDAGNYDFYYTGDIYDFDFDDVVYTIRRYEDTPQVAQVISCHHKQEPSVVLQGVPDDPQFHAVLEYMASQGVKEISVLTRKEYETVTERSNDA